MKTAVITHAVAFLVFGAIASAQDLVGASTSPLKESSIPGSYQVPAVEKAQGKISEEQPLISVQDVATLNSKATQRKTNSAFDANALKKIMVSTSQTKDMQDGLAQISALYRESGKTETSSDCHPVALSVEQRVKADASLVLEIVEKEVAANPGCACEIVKAAISASNADVDQVVSIVRSAIHASPESMRIVSQCAIAVCPDAVAKVQALLAELDPNAGESGYSAKSAKSAKSGKESISEVGPAVSSPGSPLDMPPTRVIPPVLIVPPAVTAVNPVR